MLDDIIEVVLELIFDGAIEAAGSKRVPMPIRILLGGVILVFALGVIGLLLWAGINTRNTGLIVLAAVLLVFFSGLVIFSVRRYRRKDSR